MGRATKIDQLVGANVRKVRTFRGIGQDHIAERMAPSHPTWVRQTVSEIERGQRAVTVGELVDLAGILEVTATLLLAEALDVTAVL
jgi:transcriptional regulator with XRE-family HTH domain